jgi:hypothetical protein
MSTPNFRIKYNDTRRSITLIVEEDGTPFDLSEITAAELRIIISGETRIVRTFMRGDETGELYYRPTAGADWTAASGLEQGGKYQCELWLTFTDGTKAPVPSIGTCYLYVDASIAAPV